MFLVLLSLVLTIILEVPLVYIGFGKIVQNKRKLLVNAVLINIITNVSLSVFLLDVIRYVWVEGWTLLAVEVLVVIVEMLMYHYAAKEIPWRRAAVISVLVNLFSAIVGTYLLLVIVEIVLADFIMGGYGNYGEPIFPY